MEKEQIIKGAISIFLTSVTYMFGKWDVALQTLILFMVLDYITGVISGFINGKIDSRVGLKGVFKKVGFLIIVAVVCQADKMAGATGGIRATVIFYFVGTEGISILENWAKMGLPIPKILLEKLAQLKNIESVSSNKEGL